MFLSKSKSIMKTKGMKNDFKTQNFEIFDKVVHNFGKSDDVFIHIVKKCLFPLDAYIVSCPTRSKKSVTVSSLAASGWLVHVL